MCVLAAPSFKALIDDICTSFTQRVTALSYFVESRGRSAADEDLAL
jgi:hypothetical protein